MVRQAAVLVTVSGVDAGLGALTCDGPGPRGRLIYDGFSARAGQPG
jgi:hypothetical protein